MKKLFLLCASVQLSALFTLAKENNCNLTDCKEFDGEDTGVLIPKTVESGSDSNLSLFMEKTAQSFKGVKFYTSKTYDELVPIPATNSERGIIEGKQKKTNGKDKVAETPPVVEKLPDVDSGLME